MTWNISNFSESHIFIAKNKGIDIVILHTENSGFFLMLKNVIDRLELDTTKDSFNFFSLKSNDKEANGIINKYKIRQIPAILFFKNGILKYRLEGIILKIEFLNRIQTIIKD